MSLIFNTNEVLTTSNLLLTYNISKLTIENLIEKIGYSIQTNETTKDTLISLFKNESVPVDIDENIFTNVTKNDEVFKSIPMKIKLNIVNDEVYLFTMKHVYIINIDTYNTILEDSYIKNVSECSDVELMNTYGNCINDECYILFTSLYHLYNIGIPHTELSEIGMDNNSKLIYLHIEVPTVYLELMLDKITGYKIYFTNTHTREDVWIPKEYFDDIFDCDISAIKHTRVRDFVWYIRTMFKDSDMDNDKVVKSCYDVIVDRLSSEYNELDIVQVYDDFPLLRELGDFSGTEVSKLTIIGDNDKINISTDTEYVLLNNILEKLKEDIVL